MTTVSLDLGRERRSTSALHEQPLHSAAARWAMAWGSVAVAALDITECKLYYGIPFAACYRGVAKGLLGPAARNGGLAAALVGAALHLLICFAIVVAYDQAARRIPALVAHAVPCGLLYGVAVFAFMNYLVVPLSAAGSFDRLPLSLPFLLNGVLGQAFCVGLPAALFVRWAAASRTNGERRGRR